MVGKDISRSRGSNWNLLSDREDMGLKQYLRPIYAMELVFTYYTVHWVVWCKKGWLEIFVKYFRCSFRRTNIALEKL